VKEGPFIWSGRVDSAAPERFHQRIQPFSVAKAGPQSVTLLRFACDAGVVRNNGRPGAQLGPRALCEQLANLCVPADFAWDLFDGGEVSCQGDALEESQVALAHKISEVVQTGSVPLVLGGGHETAWGTFQGLMKPITTTQTLGILNFDAHFDLRPLGGKEQRGNSGTPFNQMALWCAGNSYPFDYSCIGIQEQSNSASLWQRARELNVGVVTAEELHLAGPTTAQSLIANMVDRCAGIYLSLCLDVFAAAYAPGVSAPSALGLTPWQVLPLLHQVLASGKVVALEVVELSPPLDEGKRTAKLAASLVMEMLRQLPKIRE
jgi:formiminoglutamase